MLFFLAPDWDIPSAGCRKIYKDVEILNRSGIPACVLHQKEGFCCSWFNHNTPIRYYSQAGINPAEDFLVIPEVYGSDILNIAPGVRKVIFNQNYANTWAGYPVAPPVPSSPYTSLDVVACLCASSENRAFLEFAFPGKHFYDIRYSVDPKVFYFQGEKQKKIAYMPHKRRDEIQAVINMLLLRGNLSGFELTPIENRTEEETAQILRDSYLFLSFSFPEGFSLVAAEAFACGCQVVGYYNPDYFCATSSYPCSPGDLRGFVENIELAIEMYKDSELEKKLKQRISESVMEQYSPEKEERRTLEIWENILQTRSTTMSPRGNPKYSIIIPCWNHVELTEKCLTSVMEFSQDHEVILVNNGSTDRTLTLFSEFQKRYPERIRIRHNASNEGWPKAINQGMALALGEFCVWLNNDTQVSSHWLEKLSYHLNGNIGAIGPVSENGGWWQNLRHPASGDPKFLTGFCWMMRKSVYQEIGPLDIKFSPGGSDDIDYSIRLTQAGYQVTVARDVIIDHAAGSSFESLPECGGKFGTAPYASYMLGKHTLLLEKWGKETVERIMSFPTGDNLSILQQDRDKKYGAAKDRLADLGISGTNKILSINFAVDNLLQVEYTRGGIWSYVYASFDALPYEEKEFDAVVAANLTGDLQGMLREMFRVCRPGGKVILATSEKSSDEKYLRSLFTAIDKNLTVCISTSGRFLTASNTKTSEAPALKDNSSKVFIAIPHYKGVLRVELANFLLYQSWKGNLQHFPFFEGRPHDANRNSIVKEFLGNRKEDYLLMCDTGVVPPYDILDLVNLDLDVVAGLCFSWQEGIPFALVLDEVPGGFKQSKEIPPNTLLQRDAVGAGCLLIHRRVLESISPPWFKFEQDEWGCLKGGEDFDFCKKARKHGFKVHVHTGYMCSHYGEVDIKQINNLLVGAQRDASIQGGKEVIIKILNLLQNNGDMNHLKNVLESSLREAEKV